MRSVLRVALAILLAWSSHALAQEGRDYGGTLNIGPNFKEGGQYSPPVYGPKAEKKRTAIQRVPRGKVSKTPAESAAGPRADNAVMEPEAENAASSSTNCKKFDPTTGRTITVPCE